MRLLELAVEGFRGWREGTLALDRPLTLVVGANGRGKSSTLNAIEWCLHGKEAERKGSGVPERWDWKVAREDGPVAVSLLVDTSAGHARVVRRRAAGARARDGDELRVEREGREALVGADAEAWLLARGRPDWTTWRRAFCQHQEVLRARLVEGADRSSVLAALLGLEEHQRLRRTVDGLNPGKAIRELDAVQDELESSLLELLSRPAEEIEEEERRLEHLGIERSGLRPELLAELTGELVEAARRLADELELDAAVPDPRSGLDEPAFLRWAEEWPAQVLRRADAARALTRLRSEHAGLAAHLERVGLAEERWRRERDRLDAVQREHGGREDQEAELTRVRASLGEAEEELRREDARLSLLTDARRHMGAHGETDGCPVCGARIPELLRRLDAEIEQERGEHRRALEERLASLREREARLDRRARELEQLDRSASDALEALEREVHGLEGILPAEALAGGRGAVAGARERERALRADADRLEASHARLEAELDGHRRRTDRLRALLRWRAARQRAARRAEVARSGAWAELEDALDAAAGMAADLEVLGAMLRDVQGKDSAEREREVNGALAGGQAAILGEATRDLVVRVRQTPRGLGYELEDGRGTRVLSTWNQAALNAVSLTLLFAQASERARRGEPAFVLLDDPTQGLDPEPQRGLARAIARLAEGVPVVVAAPPGPLADELWERGDVPRRRVVLGPWEEARGAWFETEQER